MLRIYLKNGNVIETDDTLTETTKRDGQIVGLKWDLPKSTGTSLRYVDVGEIVAVVTSYVVKETDEHDSHAPQ